MTRDLGPQNVFMDRFTLEPKVQRVWDAPHATWFTLMGVGGGIFVLARLLGVELDLGVVLGIPLADVISFAAIAVGGLILIADLGKPMRFIRAVLNPSTSWISRGAIADFVFLLTGGLLVLPALELGDSMPFEGLPWDAAGDDGFGRVLEIVAVLAAVVVMFYAGQVLAAPRAIPYWHSPLIPLQFLLSSAATSLALVMLLETANDHAIPAGQCWLLAGFLVLLLAAIGAHLRARRGDARQGREHRTPDPRGVSDGVRRRGRRRGHCRPVGGGRPRCGRAERPRRGRHHLPRAPVAGRVLPPPVDTACRDLPAGSLPRPRSIGAINRPRCRPAARSRGSCRP